MPPSALRRRAREEKPTDAEFISLTLGYREPLDWGALLAFFAGRATPGVEYVDGDVYARTISIGALHGWIRARPSEEKKREVQKISNRRALRVDIAASLTPELMPLLAKLRALFDLDADPDVIGAALAASGLEEQVRARPGLRVPGAVDGFDLALRAVLGQQVSVKGATTLAGRFAEKFGTPIETPDPRLRFGVPLASRVAAATIDELRALGVTGARANSIHALATEVASGRLTIEPSADVSPIIAQLLALPGIGDWTAQYVAMRALRWPDGFPASDLWLRRAAGDMTAAKLERESAKWQPWRAYAAMHLWHSLP